MNTPWPSDWVQQIYRLLNVHGYSCVLEFLDANPGATYAELGKRVGDDEYVPPPFAFHLRQFVEATQQRRPDSEILRDQLVRYIRHHFPEGWRLDEASNFTRNLAVSSWVSHAEVNGRMEHHESGFNKVVQLILREHPPLNGWLPASKNDAYLVHVFRLANLI